MACLRANWHLDPCTRLATIDMDRKLGVMLPFGGGGAGSPSNTMSLGLRPTFLPSGILIHGAVWPADMGQNGNSKYIGGIFPTMDSVPASGLTPRLYDWSVSSEHIGFYSARNARIASAILATAIPSVRLSVCLSVTRRHCVKTTARSTVQFAPLDSEMCLVL